MFAQLASMAASNKPLDAPRQLLDDPVPEWIITRLHNMGEMEPRYEASYRGAHNAFLQSYFPASQNFLIKTETRLRQPVTTDDPKQPNERTSIDSNGQHVHIRANDGVPDFVVCFAT
ncbi:hypothetical protein HGRIS_001079 [Hohenbuehelia grisea]|uniref:Uncharacterized protein n=1 Tax=Hohenbuehelia grisea TaxID=104357 RepID=A0ABR3JQ28_9AGAR